MRKCRTLLQATLLILAGAARSAHGAEGEAQTQSPGRAHFETGRAYVHSERWEEAAAEFRASVTIDPSVGGFLNLGNAYEKLGKLASAVDAFTQAEALAGADDPERAEEARARASALAPRVPTITVKAAIGHRIRIDARIATSGERVKVDPGSHLVIVERASGHASRLEVSVQPAEHPTIFLRGDEDRPAMALVPRESPEPEPTSSSPRTLGWVGLGTGLAALAASGILYGFAAEAKGDLEATCVAYPRCRTTEIDAARSLDDSARTLATFATVSAVAGLLLVAVGGALWIAAPRSDAASARRSARTSP
jgi:tetratricopeptide (TPR) repeat protein